MQYEHPDESWLSADERDYYRMLLMWPDVENYPQHMQDRALSHWRDLAEKAQNEVIGLIHDAIVSCDPPATREVIFDRIADALFAHGGCTDEPTSEAPERTVADMLADWSLDDEMEQSLFVD